MPTPGGVMVWRSVCALGVVLGVVAHGVKVSGVVVDGVADVVRPDAVLGVVAHGVKLLRSCGAFPSPRLEEVGSSWSVCEPCTLYIYNRRKQIILIKNKKLFVFIWSYKNKFVSLQHIKQQTELVTT